jgi:hypothetical protein
MSVSFLDGARINQIRNDILKLNLGVTFDAIKIGEGQSVFFDRGRLGSVNTTKLNVLDEPRVLDFQEPISLSLIRKNKYNSSADGYRLVSIEENPEITLSNENKTEYDELIQPYIGQPISNGGSRIVDIKTLILNGNIGTYKDTPLGLVGIRSLDVLLKENIAANIESSAVGRFNSDPISLLKGNSLIIPNRTITQVSEPSSPTDFLKAGINTTNEYLGYTSPVSLIPKDAIGWQEYLFKKQKPRDRGDSKFSNFLDNIDKGATSVKNAIGKTLSILGVGNPSDISTEARMEVLLKYTGDGQKESIFNNLSQNLFQPGYEYQQSLLKVKKLSGIVSDTIANNLRNRGDNLNSVYGILNTKVRYGQKLKFRGANELIDNDPKSVLKPNGMVRITPETDSEGNLKNIKSYMFSIENLAWADVPDAFMGESEIGVGDPSSGLRGKIMWFPPYDLKVDESTSADWGQEDFLGRPEPVFTYNNSTRSGSLSFKILVDHPSIINAVRGTQGDTIEKYFAGEIDIKDLTPSQIKGNNEDEKRGLLKKIIGNVKRKKEFSDKNQSPETNPNTPTGTATTPPGAAKLNNIFSEPGKENDEKSNFYSDVEQKWFKELKATDSIIFKYISEKIQYFHPAFHSTSPEGFNSRLTFLQQCLRQGPSITEGGSSYGNLAFGRPPVCILRIGDFYNTKVVFDSLSISYDDSGWDLNPDGIGVQPMIASITLQFKMIGGSSLTGPINKLQNAVSFNFFANTEVYESRSQFWSKENVKDKNGNNTGEKRTILKSGLDLNVITKEQKQNSNTGTELKSSPSGDQVAQSNNILTSLAGGQSTAPLNNLV